MAKIDRFIEKFPDQVAADFKNILKQFRNGEMSERKARRLINEKIDLGFRTVKPHRENNKFEREVKKAFP